MPKQKNKIPEGYDNSATIYNDTTSTVLVWFIHEDPETWSRGKTVGAKELLPDQNQIRVKLFIWSELKACVQYKWFANTIRHKCTEPLKIRRGCGHVRWTVSEIVGEGILEVLPESERKHSDVMGKVGLAEGGPAEAVAAPQKRRKASAEAGPAELVESTTGSDHQGLAAPILCMLAWVVLKNMRRSEKPGVEQRRQGPLIHT
eukprot:gnl/TRDRNA2_/TRDRNA2_40678_c0_seq1.p2 gnl/TRDRNA2_/TRDRNA2_40678_c0~~gnl/TRDRNA2_/TRDRNA2_40678_c0_seq1.p2  ORF type:complete len:203 (+),score=31.45 gnl/TRDRNA2_/TRDRNA2_40678_c0_seq1:91-699(+)